MLYEYFCEKCQLRFEARKPMKERETAQCPKCGELAPKVISVVNHTFGWRLSDDSHIKGHKDKLVRDI